MPWILNQMYREIKKRNREGRRKNKKNKTREKKNFRLVEKCIIYSILLSPWMR